MEKRYQVFVSSTYKDLQEERAEVIRALLEMDCIPAGMELFPASNDAQFELIKHVIDDCDYYILIIGGRYGSTDEKGISFTEKEFDYAIEKRIPILVFPIDDPEKMPFENTEGRNADAWAKLASFRMKAMKDRMAKTWISADDLAGKVSRSLIQQIKSRPAEGWIRGKYAGDPETVLKYVRRIEELENELNLAKTTPPKGIEEFAQEEDAFSIRFTAIKLRDDSRQDRIYYDQPTTWNKIISIIGPKMFDEINEYDIKGMLQIYFQFKVQAAIVREGRKPFETVTDVAITEECFQTIKMQMKVLGIIRKGEMNGCWRLTSYGESYITKLKAIKRSPLPQESVN